jgi:hypothetical protein
MIDWPADLRAGRKERAGMAKSYTAAFRTAGRS